MEMEPNGIFQNARGQFWWQTWECVIKQNDWGKAKSQLEKHHIRCPTMCTAKSTELLWQHLRNDTCA